MERNKFGTCIVTFSEVDGLLVTHAELIHSSHGAWTACRNYDGISGAVHAIIMDEFTDAKFGFSYASEAEAIAAYREIEDNERIARNEAEGLCHCGHPFFGSDHCPFCECEQFERYCKKTYHDSLHGRAECKCEHHVGFVMRDGRPVDLVKDADAVLRHLCTINQRVYNEAEDRTSA